MNSVLGPKFFPFRIQDKGSRFVIVTEEEYQEKMFEQLNNSLHYNKLDYDPTKDHHDIVKAWANKWLGKGRSLVKSQSG